MAINTRVSLRNKVMYSVYVRNHGINGTFKNVEEDLERIKCLGTDIIWLMPIHPIGIKNKKGEIGCPYAIKNYREVNPEYGSLEEFKSLLMKIHSLGMKCIIDVVYNHTSPDSWLVENHPEFFYKKTNGLMGNKVGEWTDVVDLDYNNMKLWDYQIETLKYWTTIGVDGFRCDVAPLVPLEFWLSARAEVAKINENIIWLSESVHPEFILTMRKNGFVGLSDSEIYQAFDMAYDYDVNVEYLGYLSGKNSLKQYIDRVSIQESTYPDNYVKLRFLENHDQPRAKELIPDEETLRIWTGFLYFQKGCTLLYAGQEAEEKHTPSLFDVDKINLHSIKKDFVDLLKTLGEIKKREIMAKGFYEIYTVQDKDVILSSYKLKNRKLVGIFNVGKEQGEIIINVADGKYRNLTDGTVTTVAQGKLVLENKIIIFEI
ncbi:alpha-amylase [Clostridium bowmanii]|uniref:alpha-amylase family glycosyl hydrolase n=1 Tax=Clostridium bowmanii TaxID=132925 RepID=UPI001C0B4742|nr:alpha-amylase family glycosyl hydrolase [Clostridium bowmanii]MBU3190837.1 alpha-amylase [Clostridium bowmanii]MCA1075260.1 alpha-amylase [Clostridium bowmanii]